MDMEGEIEIESGSEQRPGVATPLVEPERRSMPRGRPWVKGQSGNPAGRPPRAHPTAAVAEYLIGRKTIPLTKKLIGLALAGDRTALRLCISRIAPPGREASDWLGLPLVEDRAELRALVTTVTEAAEKGIITPTQSDALVRIAKTLLQMS
jgi:hypothetical protein